MNTSAGLRIAALSLSLFLLARSAIYRVSSQGGYSSNRYAGTPSTLALDSLDGLEIQAAHEKGLDPVKVTADVATYRGRRALHLLNDDSLIVNGNPSGGQSLAIVRGSDFKDGSIEVDVVGLPRKGSPPDTRGFVGLAFRAQDHGSRFEAFYLRFTNGRADDQLQRNHAPNTCRNRIFPGFACARKILASTSHTWISNQKRGQSSGWRSQARKRGYT